MKLGEEWQEVGGEEEQALGFERATDAGDGDRELLCQQRLGLRWRDVFVEGALENMGEHQAEFLEFDLDGFRGLPC